MACTMQLTKSSLTSVDGARHIMANQSRRETCARGEKADFNYINAFFNT